MSSGFQGWWRKQLWRYHSESSCLQAWIQHCFEGAEVDSIFVYIGPKEIPRILSTEILTNLGNPRGTEITKCKVPLNQLPQKPWANPNTVPVHITNWVPLLIQWLEDHSVGVASSLLSIAVENFPPWWPLPCAQSNFCCCMKSPNCQRD